MLAKLSLLAGLMVSMTGCSTTTKTSGSGSAKAQLMFVQSAEDVAVDPAKKTLRLVKVNQQTLYFSDRPVRMAGHYTMTYDLHGVRGRTTSARIRPTPRFPCTEPSRKEQVMVVMKISNPVVDGADLLYTYKVIEGAMPVSGGATALFIDWVAARRGVGAGGVGGPGVGGPRGVGW